MIYSINYKVALGVLTLAIAFVSYVPYFRDIIAGRTKPHTFSWFVWTVLTGIAFGVQVAEHAGPGAWATGITTLLCLVVFVFGLVKGNVRFPLVDWLCLGLALVGLVLWQVADNPIAAVILITLTDAFAFIPTFRKGYVKPYEDTPSTFWLSGLKFFISLFALESVTLSTWLYPASLVLTNWVFVTMVYMRRKQIVQKTG